MNGRGETARLRTIGLRAAALVVASLLAACQHMPDVDGLFSDPAARTETAKPRTAAPRKQQAAQKPAQRVALRGAQAEAPSADGPSPESRARASALRATALEQLNKGDIDAAVANLKAARQLDPANDLVKRDLDRATRIQSTVSERAQ